MFVDFVIFIFVAKCYKYKKIQTEETYEPITIAAVGEKQEPPAYHNLGYSDENYQTKLWKPPSSVLLIFKNVVNRYNDAKL